VARWLEHAGELREAMDVLAGWLEEEGANAAADERNAAAMRMLGMATEVAEVLAANGDRKAAVATLDRCLPFSGERSVRLRWHLSRLEFWKQVEDFDAYEKEQRALYAFMEGRQ